ncbi:MAG: L,D-transpeptidase family protein [bacterium]|jgi:murein L,D-transpeptidase YafK|nr:L,D-transpeptidase family protein [Betaproteobacteria bacterium]
MNFFARARHGRMNDLVPPVLLLSLLVSLGSALFFMLTPAEDVHALGRTPGGGGSIGAPSAAGSLQETIATTLGAGSRTTSDVETTLVRGILELARSRPDAALAEIDRVLLGNPNFRLAHLVRGDLLMARSRPLTDFGNSATGAAGNAPEPADRLERVDELRAEARARLTRLAAEPPPDRLPRHILQLDPRQRYAIVVDSAKSTLYVFEQVDGRLRYLKDYYISVGRNGVDKMREGDKRTPLGVYHVRANLPRQKLPDFYGSGALPINYPNELDRIEGRTGHGIWLHGVPSDTFARPPQSSDGCVVLANPDFDALLPLMQIGLTPVVIAPRIEWVDASAIQATRASLAQAVEAWRRDWEGRDMQAYLRHYSATFTSTGQARDLAAWSEQKGKVNASKTWVRIGLRNTSMFLDPNRDNLAVVQFDQEYSSNNLNQQMRKRQYWRLEGGVWRIVYEGNA